MKNVHVLCDISLVRSRLDTCFYVIDFFFPCFDEFCMGMLAGTLQFSKPF